MDKILKNIFFVLTCLAVTAAFWVSKDLLFPFVTTKAFFFRVSVQLALPFYCYFLLIKQSLRPDLKNPISLLVLVFLLINFISSFLGVNVSHSLWGNFERMGGAYYIAHLTALYFYVLMLGQMQGKYLQRFLKFLLWTGIAVAVNGIFGWLGLPTVVRDPSLPGRVSSTLGNPIYLGSYLIIPLFLSLFFAQAAQTAWRKLGYYFLAFLSLFGILLSGTRGAVMGLLLGCFISALVFLFYNKKTKVRVFGFASVGVFVVLAAVMFNYSDKLPQGTIIQRIFKLKDSNTEARLIQWKTALLGFKDHPVLGVGPENYYIVANSYYNSELFKYDRSWFDKPHNYLLEILITNGVAGFLAYAGILLFVLIAFIRGFKAGFYSLWQLNFLLAALLAYQIQNLFVFDTVPASLMFFSFIGFAGYIWDVVNQEKKHAKTREALVTPALAWSAFGVAAVISAYGIYATNFIPLAVAKNVNYGFAYASVDANQAVSYFNKALALPFNFDPAETASKYSDFASGFLRASNEGNRALAVQTLDNSIAYLEGVLSKQPDNPILWQRLFTGYLHKTVQVGDKVVVDPKAEEAINKSIALAPQREDVYLGWLQLFGLTGRLAEAKELLKSLISRFPTDSSLPMQLSRVYISEGDTANALAFAKQALAAGYLPSGYSEVKWMVDYYIQLNLLEEAVALLGKTAKIDKNNIALFVDYAKVLAQAGQLEKAKNMANEVMNFDPTKKQEMQALLDSLPKTATTTQ